MQVRESKEKAVLTRNFQSVLGSLKRFSVSTRKRKSARIAV
jgi:hypothetical protein